MVSAIDITDETFDMSELCLDDNEYDVIINKYKLVEGIDIKIAHKIKFYYKLFFSTPRC